jgi:hypothetical protein
MKRMDKKPRRDKGHPRWTTRDVWVIPWIAEQYALRFDQLLELLSRQPLGQTQEEGWVGEATVRHWLERWRKAEVIGYASLLVGQPGWVWVTRKGLQTLDLDFRMWEPNPARLRHLYYCNEVKLMLTSTHPEASWYAERVLRNGLDAMRKSDEMIHMPDAEFLFEDGEAVAIEVEISKKTEGRLHEIFQTVCTRYTGIWYYTLPSVTPHIRAALDSWERSARMYRQKFRVIELEETW